MEGRCVSLGASCARRRRRQQGLLLRLPPPSRPPLPLLGRATRQPARTARRARGGGAGARDENGRAGRRRVRFRGSRGPLPWQRGALRRERSGRWGPPRPGYPSPPHRSRPSPPLPSPGARGAAPAPEERRGRCPWAMGDAPSGRLEPRLGVMARPGPAAGQAALRWRLLSGPRFF